MKIMDLSTNSPSINKELPTTTQGDSERSEELVSLVPNVNTSVNKDQTEGYQKLESKIGSKLGNFKCDLCPRTYTRKYSSKSHQKIHGAAKSYQCSQCDYKAHQKSSVTSHEWRHSDKRPFPCDICDATFSQPIGLNRHKVIHSNDFPFKCPYHNCPKRFKRIINLTIHESWHLGEKPHACIQCPYRTTAKYTLMVHERSHSGEKPFRCVVCGHKSTDVTNMKNHVKAKHKEQLKSEALTNLIEKDKLI